MSSKTTATPNIRGSVGRRAASSADRIEEGAALLAAFAGGLSEEECTHRCRLPTVVRLA